MFDSLSTRIQDAFQSLRGEVRLTEEHVETALREIRLALLEADVNFKVVTAFIDRVRDKAMDQTVLKSLSPDQQVIKIVRDELLALFGDAEGGLKKDAPTPRVVLLLGLQGSGKTTTSGKLGRWLRRQGQAPADGVHRRPPAGRHSAAEGRRRPGRGQGLRDRHDGPGRPRARGRSTRPGPRASTRSSSTPPAVCTSTTS